MTERPIRVVIADDEPPARERLKELFEDRRDFEVVGECGSGRETVSVVRERRPHLLFLDVQMPRMTGFEVVEALPSDELPAIVFVTAYDEHALHAFEVHAVDYLLKPFDDRRFEETLARARARIDGGRVLAGLGRLETLLEQVGSAASDEPLEGADRPLQRLLIKRGDRATLLAVDAVDWIEAANDYVAVHAGGRVHVLDDRLARLERRLDERFVRIHRSTIVNLDRVAEFQRLFHGDYAVVLRDGTELKLSRTYRAALEARIGRSL